MCSPGKHEFDYVPRCLCSRKWTAKCCDDRGRNLIPSRGLFPYHITINDYEYLHHLHRQLWTLHSFGPQISTIFTLNIETNTGDIYLVIVEKDCLLSYCP